VGEALAKSQGLENVQIICPIYNEGKNVQTLVRRLEQDGVQFNSLRFVYDKDDDTSLPYIAELRRENESISALKNTLGPGVVKALRFGFLSAVAGPVVVVMGDNSDKLSIIPQMVQLCAMELR
jgi:dolichol-phosphate mannosyltransferase